MEYISIYDKNSGRIIATISSTEAETFNLYKSMYSYVDDKYNGDEYYIKNGIPTKRPQMQIISSNNTLTGLPMPCTVECNRHTYTVDDCVFEYGTHISGTYKVIAKAFPYLDWEGDIIIENNT
ncbi:MAG: hypothetical protein RR203_02525 [Synergistaceae bacterium]